MMDLIERLEKATGPNRTLDWEIYRRDRLEGVNTYGPHPHYTGETDTALTLMPKTGLPGNTEIVIEIECDRSFAWARIQTRGNYEGEEIVIASGESKYVAIAICIMALNLKARMAAEPVK